MDIEYKDLQPFSEGIFNETISDSRITGEVEFILSFSGEWMGNFLHPAGTELYHSKKLDSTILYCYLATQSLTFDWIGHSLLCGNYDTVLRELRGILENTFLMFNIDTQYQTQSILQKYTILENLEESDGIPYGKNLFKKSEYPDWERCYNYYQEMSKYVHISTKTMGIHVLEIAQRGFPEALDLRYSQDSFLKCSTMWRNIAVVALSLMLHLFEIFNIESGNFLNSEYLRRTWMPQSQIT